MFSSIQLQLQFVIICFPLCHLFCALSRRLSQIRTASVHFLRRSVCKASRIIDGSVCGTQSARFTLQPWEILTNAIRILAAPCCVWSCEFGNTRRSVRLRAWMLNSSTCAAFARPTRRAKPIPWSRVCLSSRHRD